jgi:hypothetical protein
MMETRNEQIFLGINYVEINYLKDGEDDYKCQQIRLWLFDLDDSRGTVKTEIFCDLQILGMTLDPPYVEMVPSLCVSFAKLCW